MSPPQQTLQRTGTPAGITAQEMSMSLVTTRQVQPSSTPWLVVWYETFVPTRYEMRQLAKKHHINTATCVRTLVGSLLMGVLVSFLRPHIVRACTEMVTNGSDTWRLGSAMHTGVAVFIWSTMIMGIPLGMSLARRRAREHDVPTTLIALFVGAASGLLFSFIVDLSLACIVKQ